MYFTDIANKELQYFHGLEVPNFNISLTDLLTCGLFKVETIISGSIYRVYPLFYTQSISSTNPDDKVLENKCIIIQKKSKETFITFISDENKDVHDYISYGSYYSIGDDLTEAQFNSIVSLLLRNNSFTDDVLLKNGLIDGVYGDYLFDLTSTTIIDTGVLVTRETLTNLGTVTLSNPVFTNATYTLGLTVQHNTDINVSEDDDNTETETLTVTLVPGEAVTIPFDVLDYNYVILKNATVTITHDKPIIRGAITNSIDISASKSTLQTGDSIVITATAYDFNDIPTPNQSIDLYKDGTKIDTFTTDQQGQIKYTYLGDGTGEHIFKASKSSIQSSNQTIMDCLAYDNGRSGSKNTDYYNFSNRLTVTTDSNGTLLQNLNSNVNAYYYINKAGTPNTTTEPLKRYAFMDYLYPVNIEFKVVSTSSQSNGLMIYDGVTEYKISFSDTGVTIGAGDVFRVVWLENQVLLYVNDTLTETLNIDNGLSEIGLFVAKTESLEYTDFKIFTGTFTPTITIGANPETVNSGSTSVISGVLSAGSGKSVKIYNGSNTLLDTVTTITGGAYSYTTSALTSETSFYAVFEGDSIYGSVTSETVTVSVGAIPTTTSLSAVSNSITIGDTPSLTGTLSAGSGLSVKIYDGSDNLLDTVTTGTGGAFSYTGSATSSAGTLTYYAVFEGNDSYLTSTSSDVNITVNKHSATITTATSSNSCYVNGSITFTGTLKIDNVGTSGLSVKIYKDSTLLDTVTTGSDGAFSKSISFSSVGSSTIYAEYEGSTVNSSATSSTYTITVNKLPTTLTINVPALVYSDIFSITGTLKDTNNNAIGSASVKLYMETGGTTTLEATGTTDSNGEVTFSRNAPTSITTYKFYLVYEGSTNYSTVTSSEESRTVGKETSVLTVTTPANNASVNSTVNISGTLLSNDGEAMASKSVVVKENGSTLTTLTTGNDGSFTGSVSGLASGSHSLSFEFAGDSYYTSCTVSRSITVASVTVSSIALTGNKSVLSYYHNDSVTVTATVTGSDSNPYSGASVSFGVYKSSDDSLVETLTGCTTNGSGVCTASYSSKGSGDLYIKAECMNLQETYSIEDCRIYDPTEYSCTKSSGSVKNEFINSTLSLTLPSDFEMEFKVKTTGGSTSAEHRLFIMPRTLFVSNTQPTKAIFVDNRGCGSNGQFGYRNSTTSSIGSTFTDFTCNNYHTVKIVKQGNTTAFYFNGNQKASTTAVTFYSSYTDWCPCFHIWNNGTYYLKEFKLKPL